MKDVYNRQQAIRVHERLSCHRRSVMKQNSGLWEYKKNEHDIKKDGVECIKAGVLFRFCRKSLSCLCSSYDLNAWMRRIYINKFSIYFDDNIMGTRFI